MKYIKTIILYSQVILLLDQLSRHSQVVILSPLDKTVCLLLAVILAVWKISVNYWKLPCCYKYFDCGIWLNIFQITSVQITKGQIIEGLVCCLCIVGPWGALQKFINGSNNCKRSVELSMWPSLLYSHKFYLIVGLHYSTAFFSQ